MSPYISEGTSVDATMVELGRRLAAWRIAKRYTQAQLADMAGVARATVQRLEAGQGGELRTFISMLGALDKVAGLEAVLPEVGPSPIDLLKLEGKRRKRVRSSAQPSATRGREPWKWGDDQ